MDGWIDARTDGWRHKQLQHMQVLDVAVKTNPGRTRMKIHSRIDTVSLANSWLLTGVPTCPASYLFIGHFMRDRRDAAKFGALTDKTTGGRKLFLSASQRLTE